MIDRQSLACGCVAAVIVLILYNNKLIQYKLYGHGIWVGEEVTTIIQYGMNQSNLRRNK
jgi:hypothetical protein